MLTVAIFLVMKKFKSNYNDYYSSQFGREIKPKEYEEISFKENFYDFLVNCNVTDKSDINLHKYQIVKNNIE